MIYGYPRVSIHRHSVEAHVRQLREPLLSKRYSTKWRAEPSLARHSFAGCSLGDPWMIIRRRPEGRRLCAASNDDASEPRCAAYEAGAGNRSSLMPGNTGRSSAATSPGSDNVNSKVIVRRLTA
jgi:hypothetical protein